MILSRDLAAIFSGGGISFCTSDRNAKFSYGYSSFKGKRPSMEDFYETRISEVDGHMVAFFGVFDGHGGSRTAEYLKNNLFKNLSSHPDFITDTKSAIAEVFRRTDADYLNEEKGQARCAGSTASTAVLVGDRLLVANVGDSRVVACRAGSAIPLSTDHKPDRSDERQRIEDAGGFVVWSGTWRVGGVLAVSRAFGDKLLKAYVIADPEIQEQEIDGVDFVIIASDGLWNALSNKEQEIDGVDFVIIASDGLWNALSNKEQEIDGVDFVIIASDGLWNALSNKEQEIDGVDFVIIASDGLWNALSNKEQEIDGVDFVIIASDGLWNALSNKEAVAIVQEIMDAEAASRRLIHEAYARGSSDNITCVVVRFKIS